MKNRVIAALLCMVLSVGLVACGSGKEDGKTGETTKTEKEETTGEDSHINMALFTYIEGLDPAEGWGGWNLTRCGVGETLITVNEDMEFVGQLSDKWEQVDDVTYRVHIRLSLIHI